MSGGDEIYTRRRGRLDGGELYVECARSDPSGVEVSEDSVIRSINLQKWVQPSCRLHLYTIPIFPQQHSGTLLWCKTTRFRWLNSIEEHRVLVDWSHSWERQRVNRKILARLIVVQLPVKGMIQPTREIFDLSDLEWIPKYLANRSVLSCPRFPFNKFSLCTPMIKIYSGPVVKTA